MFVIKVTNFAGDSLYVCSTAYKGRHALNFRVKILKFAKKFKTIEDAERAIRGFNPHDRRTKFEVISTGTESC